MRIGVLLALVVVATACSADPAKLSEADARRAQTDDPSKGIVCTERIPTGSSFPEKHCTTPAEREAERLHYNTLDFQAPPGFPRNP